MEDFVRRVLETRRKPDSWDGQPFDRAEVKYDGWRLTIICKPDDSLVAVGRKEEIDLWPKMAGRIGFDLPPGSAVDGEIFVPGQLAADVPSALNGEFDFEFRAFDLPWYKGEQVDHPNFYRRASLQAHGFEVAEITGFGGNATRREMLDYVVKREIEGLVLKNSAGDWWKLKPVNTMDFLITDCVISESDTYYGQIKSFRIGYFKDGTLVPFGVVPGLNEELRAMDPDSVKGRVIEVKFNGMLKNRMRFPRFERWRDDKPASECVWNIRVDYDG